MRKKFILLVFFMLFVNFLNINNTLFNQYNTTENDSTVHYPRNSVASSIIFGTTIAGRTTIEVDQYYSVNNVASTGTYYVEIELLAGQIYYISTSNTISLYLYKNSGFSEEIESYSPTEDDYGYTSLYFCYAPLTSGKYYIKFTNYVSNTPLIGVFKAVKYSAAQVLEGVAYTFVNDDWGGSLIYFTAPNIITCSDFEEIFDFGLGSYSHRSYKYRQIDINSDQAYNPNEIKLADDYENEIFGGDVKNNAGKGFLIIIHFEGNFQIDISGCPPVIDPIVMVITLIIVVIIAIVVLTIFAVRKRRSGALARVKLKGLIEDKKAKKREESDIKAKAVSIKSVKKEKKKDVKKLERLKEGQLDPGTLKKLKQIMSVSTKVKLDLMKEALGISDYLFKNLIFDWAEKYGFEIEGDYIIINKETINEFMDDLDEAFKGWGDEKDHKKI